MAESEHSEGKMEKLIDVPLPGCLEGLEGSSISRKIGRGFVDDYQIQGGGHAKTPRPYRVLAPNSNQQLMKTGLYHPTYAQHGQDLVLSRHSVAAR